MGQNKSSTEKIAFISGLAFILLGLSFNEWLIAWWLVSDGVIESENFRFAIFIIELAFISWGCLQLCLRRSKIVRYGSDIIIGLLFGLGYLFIFEWILSLLGYTPHLVPLANPKHFVQTFNHIEFSYEVKTNSQGLRYPELPLQKPFSQRRVVVLGDSFVEGVGVAVEETFPSLLEQYFADAPEPTKFINCGLAATGPVQYARILFHLCLDYQPDIVLLVLYANDVSETMIQATVDNLTLDAPIGLKGILYQLWPRSYIIMQNIIWADRQYDLPEEIDIIQIVAAEARQRGISEEALQAWINRLPPDLTAASNRREFNGYILSTGLLHPTYWVDSLDIDTEGAKKKYQIMETILDEIIARCRDLNIEVGVIFLPVAFQYDATYGDVWQQVGVEMRRSTWSTEQSAFESKLGAWTAKQALPYLNLTPIYRQEFHDLTQTPLYYEIDGHWTPAGHQVAAEAILAWFKEHFPD